MAWFTRTGKALVIHFGAIGLDDPSELSRTNVPPRHRDDSTVLGATGTTSVAYAGVRTPDVSGNIKVDQAWGPFQLSGKLYEVQRAW